MPALKTFHRTARDTPLRAEGPGPRRALIDLIVLSADHALLAVTQAAAEGELLHWTASNAEAAVEQVVCGRCGILLVDLVSLGGETAVLFEKLAAQFPALVLMAAGRREDEASVAQLITGGVIYRYIHKPLSPGRAQQFLSAAVRRYRELNDREPIGLATVREMVRVQLWQRLFQHSVRVMGVTSVVVLAALLASTVQHALQPKPELPLRATPDSAPRQPLVPPQRQALESRQRTMDQTSRSVEPPPQTAEAAPQTIQPKMQAIEAAPQRALPTSAPPTPTVSRQANTQLEEQLGSVEWLIEAGRLNDAARALRQAAALVPDDARIAIIATSIGEQLLRRATVAVGEEDFAAAQRRLEAARALDREYNLELPDLRAVTTALQRMRAHAERREIDGMLAIVRARRTVGELISPDGASAYDQLQLARTRAPNDASVQSEAQALAFALIEAAERSLAEQRPDAAATLLDRAEELVPSMNAARELRRQMSTRDHP